jgi:hypothetical protein
MKVTSTTPPEEVHDLSGVKTPALDEGMNNVCRSEHYLTHRQR